MRRLQSFLQLCALQAVGHWRNRQALAYSLGVPLLFLLGFGAVFRASQPPLLDQIGQLLTITLLGGACFGFPVTLVSEREAGVWRRHRLAPVSRNWILSPIVVVRCGIISASVLLQLGLARLLFGTPGPESPVLALAAFGVGLFAFLGVGLLLTSVADSVPAVQALGQSVFLPMILFGGVGVPLAGLPEWAQVFSAFLPGRYSVELLQAAWIGAPLREPLPWLALAAMGAGGFAAGGWLFRWQPRERPAMRQRLRAVVGLTPWLAVGLTVAILGRWEPPTQVPPYRELDEATLARVAAIAVPPDDSLVTPMSGPKRAEAPEVLRLIARLGEWSPATRGTEVEQVRALLGAVAIADGGQDVSERDLALAVYLELRTRHGRADLRRLLAWIALTPERGQVPVRAPELGVRRKAPEALVRERVRLYAIKYLQKLSTGG
ncbi:ABC transporter permease [Nibricoccus sp. IMCC34717]|uniref:ABC transporter permease n=1 Tax=Nibricoccus sp. IMCC34717 TaxID=3034021 RepID=UPI00384AD324